MKNFKYTVKNTAIFMLLLALCLQTLIICSPKANALENIDIKANAALLAEPESGYILYEKNADTRIAPASTTKIMTVLLAVEACSEGKASLNDIVTVCEDAYFDVTDDGSTADLRVGEELKLNDLLYAAMLPSGNEACNAIAEYIAGSIPAFINLMNKRAAELGCKGTHFENTHGLPNDNHYTTARDLYLISAHATTFPAFTKIVKTSEYNLPATNLSGPRTFKNTNELINENSRNYFEYATGIKTGHTFAAGYCLVSSAENEEFKLIAVVMGAESVVSEDGTTDVQSFSETKRLYKWGFSNFSSRTIISTLDLIADVPVVFGSGTDSVVLRPKTAIRALLPNDEDLNKVKLDIHIFNQEKGEDLAAPVSRGDVLGKMGVSLNGVNYGTLDLIANANVDMDRTEYLKSEVRKTLSSKYVKLAIYILLFILFAYILFVIIYNYTRIKKRRIAKELAQSKIASIRAAERSSIGKSFEEIEQSHIDK